MITSREQNPTIWDIATSIIKDHPIVRIELWKESFYRVIVRVGDGIDFYIIDINRHIIALYGYWVEAHGNHLKLRQNGEGLIRPIEKGFPVTGYEWEVIIPCDYSSIIDYLDEKGLIRVIKNGKCGIINEFNNVVVPIEYTHLSPIYPLNDGSYRVIARKSDNEQEYNLIIRKGYSLEKGNNDVPILRGQIIERFTKND